MSYNSNYNRYQKKNDGTNRTPKFLDSSVSKSSGNLMPLMTEEQKAADRVPIDELAFDFSCRVTRMYKWLNEAKHPQSDADYLSKTTISLKEACESEHWLRLLTANGYVSNEQFESLNHDIDRILRILITITAKVRERLKTEGRK